MIHQALNLIKLRPSKEICRQMFSNKYQIHIQIFVNAENFKQEELCHQNLIHMINNLRAV